MNKFARFAASPVAALLAAATPAENVIPRPTGGPSLISPAESPVEFQGFDEAGVARAIDRLLATGNLV